MDTSHEQGQSLISYAVGIALVIVGAFVFLQYYEAQVQRLYEMIFSALASI